IGPIEAVLQRALVENQSARDGTDRVTLSDDATLQLRFNVEKAVADITEDHILRNLRGIRHDRDDIVGRDSAASVEFCSYGGGVEPADHLVWQVQVPQVSRRHRD